MNERTNGRPRDFGGAKDYRHVFRSGRRRCLRPSHRAEFLEFRLQGKQLIDGLLSKSLLGVERLGRLSAHNRGVGMKEGSKLQDLQAICAHLLEDTAPVCTAAELFVDLHFGGEARVRRLKHRLDGIDVQREGLFDGRLAIAGSILLEQRSVSEFRRVDLAVLDDAPGLAARSSRHEWSDDADGDDEGKQSSVAGQRHRRPGERAHHDAPRGRLAARSVAQKERRRE